MARCGPGLSGRAKASGRQRRIAWVLLLASAAAVLATGLFGTIVVLSQLGGDPAAMTASFWVRLAAAAALTIASLMLRSLRWIFLLRRAHVRIPIRDAYIGYFAGLSLLLTPFLLGEIAVRAIVHRARGLVPHATVVVVNLWERLFDLIALVIITGVTAIWLGRLRPWSAGLVAVAVLTAAPSVLRACRTAAEWLARPAAHLFDGGAAPETGRLSDARTWLVAIVVSLAAWVLPGVGFWIVANGWDRPISLAVAEYAYAASSSLGGLVLAPGGVLVSGASLLGELESAGLGGPAAAMSVFGIRLATVGVATALGLVFLFVHLRVPAAASAEHFNEIADAYDVQIPEARRTAILIKKTELMRDVMARALPGARRGLDAGCGQGWYVGRMCDLGFEVDGIDASAGQVALAAGNIGPRGRIRVGSVLNVPEPAGSYDFVYTINVLHHLMSLEEQRRAFAELMRVLKPGGLLFVHEINTRNILFRFYMGYVFPSLNCIDEGIERWLLPHQMAMYTDAPLVDLRYFTFLPDFVPQALVRMLAPLERMLESSPLGAYSAHYMAVLRKPR
jgi:SAM-dependent methyltransferase